jgi:hypothetical protein
MAIQNSVARKKSILRSVGKPDLSPAEVAEDAQLRLDRAKTSSLVERVPQKKIASDFE